MRGCEAMRLTIGASNFREIMSDNALAYHPKIFPRHSLVTDSHSLVSLFAILPVLVALELKVNLRFQISIMTQGDFLAGVQPF